MWRWARGTVCVARVCRRHSSPLAHHVPPFGIWGFQRWIDAPLDSLAATSTPLPSFTSAQLHHPLAHFQLPASSLSSLHPPLEQQHFYRLAPLFRESSTAPRLLLGAHSPRFLLSPLLKHTLPYWPLVSTTLPYRPATTTSLCLNRLLLSITTHRPWAISFSTTPRPPLAKPFSSTQRRSGLKPPGFQVSTLSRSILNLRSVRSAT